MVFSLSTVILLARPRSVSGMDSSLRPKSSFKKRMALRRQAPPQGESSRVFSSPVFPNLGSQFRRFSKDWEQVLRKFPSIGTRF